MRTVFSHITALRLSRADSAPFIDRRPAARSFALPDSAPDAGQVEGLGLPPEAIDRPHHVLIERERRRRSAEHVIIHSTAGNTLPHGSILRIGDGGQAHSCSPELLFPQVASLVQRFNLVRIGMELCGSYALSPSHPSGFYARDPLTTVSRMQSYLGKVAGLKGTKQARWALQYVLPRSASPRETVVAMLFELPCAFGGCGLGKPSLNHPVVVTQSIGGVRRRQTYRIDLFWPEAKLGLEYDSDLEHTGASRIARDARRRNALESMGITMLTITNRQVKSLWEFNKLAHVVAGRLGRQIQPRCKDYRTRQRQLHTLLIEDGL